MNYPQTLYSAEFQQPQDTAYLDQHDHLCQHRFQCSHNPQVMHPHICHHQHRHKVQNIHQHQYPRAHEVSCMHQIPSCLHQPELQNKICAYKCKSNKKGKRTKAERSRYSTSTKTLTNTWPSNTTSSPPISMPTSSRSSRNAPTQPSVRRNALTSTSNNTGASTRGSIYVPPPSSVSSLSPRLETKVPKVKVKNHTPENSPPVPARSVIHASTSSSPHSIIQRPAFKSTLQYAPPLAPIQTTPPKYATGRKSTQIASTPSQNTIVNVAANQNNKQAPDQHYAVSKNIPLAHYALTSAETSEEEPTCTEIAESLLGLVSVSSLRKNLKKASKPRAAVKMPNCLPPVPPRRRAHATTASTLQFSNLIYAPTPAQKYALSKTATSASATRHALLPAPESQDFHLRDPSITASKNTLTAHATTTSRHVSTRSAPHIAAIPSQNPSVKYTSLQGPKYLPASLAAQTYALTSAPQHAPSPAPASVSSVKVDSSYRPERSPKHQRNSYQLHEEHKH